MASQEKVMAADMVRKTNVMVRISKALSEGEEIAIASRKEEVKKGLEGLGIPCDLDQVPSIAVLGAGGAVRAMMALYGTLSQLKKCNILDCVMYLGGVSGSTWCLSNLYKHEDWAEKIEALEKQQCETLVNGEWDFEKALKTLMEAVEDECYSLTDFWSYFLVHGVLNQLEESELSAHRGSCENGKNPYPIYTAVDKDTYQNQNAGTWFEFTPHEAGISGLGAYVDTKHFGSIFENGKLLEEKREKNLCYLQGLWGSALGSEEQLSETIRAPVEKWIYIRPPLRPVNDNGKKIPIHRAEISTLEFFPAPKSNMSVILHWKYALMNFLKQDRSRDSSASPTNLDEEDQKLTLLLKGYLFVLGLQLYEPSDRSETDKHFDELQNILKSYISQKSHELLRSIHQNWFSSDEETKKKYSLRLCQALDTDLGGDVSFPDLTSKPVISLIDAGLAINAAYPPILRPERQVKLILSFDFSAGDPFLTIRKAAEYCEAHGIPFPKIDKSELDDVDNPSDCHIFRGDHAPTIIHCPLFNKVNCTDKIAEYRDQFSTFKMKYSEEDVEKLLTAAKQNVVNVQHKIIEEIKRIVYFPSEAN